jgi:hypothetical protein
VRAWRATLAIPSRFAGIPEASARHASPRRFRLDTCSSTKACAGPRRYDTLDELALLGERGKQVKNWDAARAIVDATQTLQPLTELMSQKEVTLSQFADALSQWRKRRHRKKSGRAVTARWRRGACCAKPSLLAPISA